MEGRGCGGGTSRVPERRHRERSEDMGENRRQAMLESAFDAGDRAHHARRQRTAAIYRAVDRVFFASLLILALLVFGKLAVHVLPLFLN
jgi:hypothetical protein